MSALAPFARCIVIGSNAATGASGRILANAKQQKAHLQPPMRLRHEPPTSAGCPQERIASGAIVLCSSQPDVDR